MLAISLLSLLWLFGGTLPSPGTGSMIVTPDFVEDNAKSIRITGSGSSFECNVNKVSTSKRSSNSGDSNQQSIPHFFAFPWN